MEMFNERRTQHILFTVICYNSRGTLSGAQNSSIVPEWGIDPMTYHTMNRRSSTDLHLAPYSYIVMS